MGDIRDVVVPLYERRGPNWKGLGTASIIVAQARCAIVVTARHVLESLVAETEQSKPAYPKLSSVLAMVGSVNNSFIAEVHQIQISDFSDVAFAVLLAPEGKEFGQRLSINPAPISPGTTVAAVGYRGLPLEHEIDWDKEHFSVRMEFHVHGAEGRVLERRPEGSRRLKWPVFKVSTTFDSAMSGGPIFETQGNEPIIRGIICSDMSIGEDLRMGGGGEAWASEIWPILMMPYRFNIKFMKDNGDQIKVDTILDLFKEGLLIDRGATVKNFIWNVRDEFTHASWRGFPDVLVAPLVP